MELMKIRAPSSLKDTNSTGSQELKLYAKTLCYIKESTFGSYIDSKAINVRAKRAFGEHFATVLRDKQRVLKLRAERAIASHSRPIVRPQLVLPLSDVDHRFNGENVPRLHDADRFVLYATDQYQHNNENEEHALA